jgi:hypothetical protein
MTDISKKVFKNICFFAFSFKVRKMESGDRMKSAAEVRAGTDLRSEV